MEKLKQFYEEEIFFEGNSGQIEEVKKWLSEKSNVVFTLQKNFGSSEVLFVLAWARDQRTGWAEKAAEKSLTAAVFENVIITDFEKRELQFLSNDCTHRYFDYATKMNFAGKTLKLTHEIPAPEQNGKTDPSISEQVKKFSEEIRTEDLKAHQAYKKTKAVMEEILGKKMIDAFIYGV